MMTVMTMMMMMKLPSWREPWTKFEDWDWFNGRNYCRWPKKDHHGDGDEDVDGSSHGDGDGGGDADGHGGGDNDEEKMSRERCMDLISFNTAEEYRHFAQVIHKGA